MGVQGGGGVVSAGVTSGLSPRGCVDSPTEKGRVSGRPTEAQVHGERATQSGNWEHSGCWSVGSTGGQDPVGVRARGAWNAGYRVCISTRGPQGLSVLSCFSRSMCSGPRIWEGTWVQVKQGRRLWQQRHQLGDLCNGLGADESRAAAAKTAGSGWYEWPQGS